MDLTYRQGEFALLNLLMPCKINRQYKELGQEKRQ